MIEFKIRFKSGDLGYFRANDIETIDQAKKVINGLGEIMKRDPVGVIPMMDLQDDKITLINIKEVATIGYSKVE